MVPDLESGVSTNSTNGAYELRYQDSNLDNRIQSPICCHYIISQWQMRQELNLRPAVLETAALTGLSYAPKHPPQHTGVQDGRYLVITSMGDKAESFPTP